MVRKLRLSLLLALTLLVRAPAAAADPVQVTGGGAFGYWDGSMTSAQLFGPGLTVEWPFGFGWGQSLWPVGTMGNLNGDFTYHSPAVMHPTSVTVGGATYLLAALTGSLTFTTPSFLVEPPNQNFAVFSSPFAMTGRIRGFDADGMMLFDVDLTGTGTASTGAFFFPGGELFRSSGVRFQFEDPIATPEPASLLLLGTGLAGVLLRRRAQLRAHHSVRAR